MALDFPTSPALNQVYTFGSYSWRWDGTSWVGAVPIVNATINNTTIGAVTPSTGAFTTITANTSAVITGGASIGQAAFQATGNQASQLIANLTSNISGAGTSFGLRVAAGTNASDYALRVQNQAGTLDYLYVRGDGSVSMSTGLNSTAIGATTPSTAVFTTLYQGASGAQGLNVGFSGAAGQGFTLRDTTNSRTYFVTTETATGLQINAGANPISLIGSSVAVTGALSATGNLTLSAANPSLIGGTNAGSVSIQNPDAGAYITIYGSAHSTKANKVEIIGTGGVTLTNGLAVTGALSCTTGLTLNDGSANSPNINFQTTSGTRIMDMDGSTVRILNMAETNARLQLTDAGNLSVDGTLSCVGALAIGNTVNTVSPTSPNRTVTIVIGGTTYYLAAKTTND